MIPLIRAILGALEMSFIIKRYTNLRLYVYLYIFFSRNRTYAFIQLKILPGSHFQSHLNHCFFTGTPYSMLMAVFINELLCFVQTFLSNVSKQEILTALCGFL